MPVYNVVSRLSHNGALYGPGTSRPTIDSEADHLTSNQADELLNVGVLTPVDSAIAVPAGPNSSPVILSETSPQGEETLANPPFVELETNDEDTADLSFKTNLNTATEAELKSLKHIGAAIAKKLVAARPFATLADAQKASGLADEQWSEIEGVLAL